MFEVVFILHISTVQKGQAKVQQQWSETLQPAGCVSGQSITSKQRQLSGRSEYHSQQYGGDYLILVCFLWDFFATNLHTLTHPSAPTLATKCLLFIRMLVVLQQRKRDPKEQEKVENEEE